MKQHIIKIKESRDIDTILNDIINKGMHIDNISQVSQSTYVIVGGGAYYHKYNTLYRDCEDIKNKSKLLNINIEII